MEALMGLSLKLPLSLSSNHHQHFRQLQRMTRGFNPTAPSSSNYSKSRSGVRMQAGEEDYELKQVKDMAAARKRWEALVREEKVKTLTAREAGYAIQLTGKTLLDVRPSTEHEKAWVKGSTWIPIFEVDNSFDFGALSKKISTFMFGGWWSGVPALSYDAQFLKKVGEKFPTDTDLIVTCQKGLRSLAACEQLYNAGYRNLFWIQGGLEAAEEDDLVREGPQPFKLAGIGGFSEFLGWTDQQRAAAAKEGLSYRLVFTARLLGVIIAADGLFLGAQQVGHYLQDIRMRVLKEKCLPVNTIEECTASVNFEGTGVIELEGKEDSDEGI